MEKSYIVVVKINNIHYIQLNKSDSGYALSGYDSIEDAIEQFDGFRQKAKTPSYESHISGSLGIINLQPHVIEVHENNPESLRPYLIEEKAYLLKGGVIGAFVDLAGVKVKESILELSVYNVSDNCIKEVYSQ